MKNTKAELKNILNKYAPYKVMTESGRFTYFSDKESANDFQKKVDEDVVKTFPQKTGKEVLDYVKIFTDANKTIQVSFGNYKFGSVSVVEVKKNTDTELEFSIDDNFGTANLKIKRNGRMYFLQIEDKEQNYFKNWKFNGFKSLQDEFEYNINGLWFYLTNKDQKIEMFPNYQPFPYLNGFSKTR